MKNRCLKKYGYPSSRKTYCFIVAISIVMELSFTAILSADNHVTIIAGGDIEWSRTVKRPKIIYLNYDREENRVKRQWNKVIKKLGFGLNRKFKLPYVATDRSEKFMIAKHGYKIDKPNSHHVRSIMYNLKFSSIEERDQYPFKKIQPIIKNADIAFANLEMPLAENSRQQRAFSMPKSFANALKWAGFDIVSTANNHSMDAEGTGLIETQEALKTAGLKYIGSGVNLNEARKPVIFEKRGIKIAFFGYAHLERAIKNDYALDDRSGVMPLDPLLLEDDIKSIRDDVDYVILSFHWDTWGGKNCDIHPAAKKLAHFAIRSGADIILGHHVHLIRGVEIYKKKIIFYFFGNLIFGHNHKNWTDNYLSRIALSKEKIEKVEIIPISGKGVHLAQPEILKEPEAKKFLDKIKKDSKMLGTSLTIRENLGIINDI